MADSTIFLQFQETSVIGLLCNGYDLARSVTLRLPVTDAERPSSDLAEKLRDILADKKRKYPDRCVLVLHRRDIAFLRIALPAGSDAEISSMLGLELPEQLPLTLAEVCYGWENLGAGPDGKVVIEVYWAPLARISPLLSILNEAKLEVSYVLPTAAAYRRILAADVGALPLCFLRASDSEYEIVEWGASGECLFSRGQQAPSTSDKDREQLIAGMAVSMRKSREALQGREPVNHVFVGPQSVRESLQFVVALGDDSSPTQDTIHKLFAGAAGEAGGDFLPLVAAVKTMADSQTSKAAEISCLTGNMLPGHLSRRRESVRLKRLGIQAGLLIFGIFALLIGNLYFYSNQMERQLAAIEAGAAELKPIVAEVEAMEGRIASIKEQIDYALSPIDALLQLNKVLADNSSVLDGLYLDKMAYDAAGTITVEGHATNDITPWKFAEFLGKMEVFAVAQPPRISSRMYGATRAIRFQMGLKVVEKPVRPGGGV